MSLIRRTRQNQAYYIKDVDMRLSFDGLNKLAEKLVGGQAELGDIIVFDTSAKVKTKRKMLQKTATGYMIYYGRLDNKTEFEPLAEHSGRIKKLTQEIL